MTRRKSSRHEALAGRRGLLGALALCAAVVATPRIGAAVPPIDGACCHGTECQVVSQNLCASGQGFWNGEGSDCYPDTCNRGACCMRTGSCDGLTTETECRGLCGRWLPQTQCTQVSPATCTSYFVNAPPLPCDCNRDGQVRINELYQAVRIDLCCGGGSCPCVSGVCPNGRPDPDCLGVTFGSCPAADVDHDGTVEINELVLGINAALGHCPQ